LLACFDFALQKADSGSLLGHGAKEETCSYPPLDHPGSLPKTIIWPIGMNAPPFGNDPAHNRRRSQRVLLRMPVLAIARGQGTSHVSENTFTSSVSAHGALIYLSLKVEVGQKILIKNPETEEEQFVRVVRTSSVPDGRSEVGVEFLRPAPKFWRIAFPPDDWVPHTPEITSGTF